MWSNMHSTLKRICVTEGLLKVPIHYLRPLILLGVARGGWSRSQRGTPSISHQFISKYRQRFIVKIVGKKGAKKVPRVCENQDILVSRKREKVRLRPGVFFAHWGFTRVFLCLAETRLPTCLSLVTGLPKLPPVRLKISTHAQRMPHQCFV